MADLGRQQITSYFGKDLRSIFANQENYGLYKPGVYKCSVTPIDNGNGTIKFRIAKGSTFIFQDTALINVDDAAPVTFLTKIVLEDDADTTPTTLASLSKNTVVIMNWKYSQVVSERYATFELSNFTSDLTTDLSTNKRIRLPIAILRDYDPLGGDFATCLVNSSMSYLESSDTIDFMEDLYAQKASISSIILRNNAIAVIDGQFFANGVMNKTQWYKYSTATSYSNNLPAKQSSNPTKNALLQEDYGLTSGVATNPLTYVDPDAYPLSPSVSDTFYTSIPNKLATLYLADSANQSSFLHRFNYGYNWIIIPDARGVSYTTQSVIDAVVLLPTVTDNIDSTNSSTIDFTSRPKLRIFSTIVSYDLSLSNGTKWDKTSRELELKNKISNINLNLPTGAVVGFFVRGYGVQKIDASNFLSWTGFKTNFGGIKPNRLEVPSINA